MITLVAIDDRKVAVHPGSFLSERAGLRKRTMDAMIEQSFIPLAREGKYPEAVASLLAMIEDHVAKQGTTVTKVKAESRGTLKGQVVFDGDAPAAPPSQEPQPQRPQPRPRRDWTNSIGMKLARIEPGSFLMGST